MSASTAPTSSAWASCRSSSPTARVPSRSASRGHETFDVADVSEGTRTTTVTAHPDGGSPDRVRGDAADRHSPGVAVLPARRESSISCCASWRDARTARERGEPLTYGASRRRPPVRRHSLHGSRSSPTTAAARARAHQGGTGLAALCARRRRRRSLTCRSAHGRRGVGAVRERARPVDDQPARAGARRDRAGRAARGQRARTASPSRAENRSPTAASRRFRGPSAPPRSNRGSKPAPNGPSAAAPESPSSPVDSSVNLAKMPRFAVSLHIPDR